MKVDLNRLSGRRFQMQLGGGHSSYHLMTHVGDGIAPGCGTMPVLVPKTSYHIIAIVFLCLITSGEMGSLSKL